MLKQLLCMGTNLEAVKVIGELRIASIREVVQLENFQVAKQLILHQLISSTH